MRRYVNSLRDSGHLVYVLAISDRFHKNYETSANLVIYRFGIEKKRGTYISRLLEYILLLLVTFFRATYLFFAKDVRIYHVHTFPDFLVWATLIPRLLGAKVILDMHELTPEAMMQREKISENSLIVKTLKFIEKISIRFASEVITIHEPAAKLLHSRNNKEFNVIMNGVDEYDLRNFNPKECNEFIIVYNGTINFNLNLDYIIEALFLLKDDTEIDFSRIRFKIYGKGPALKNILDKSKELGLENIVEYKGSVDYLTMLKELEYASVCVLPPQKDNYSKYFYSQKLIESINLRIPVIATSLETYMFYYPENCLFYFEAGDIPAIAHHIKTVMLRKDLVQTKVENAINAYRKVGWVEIMRPRYLALIEKLS